MIIEEGAKVGDGVSIGHNTVIFSGVVIEDLSQILNTQVKK